MSSDELQFVTSQDELAASYIKGMLKKMRFEQQTDNEKFQNNLRALLNSQYLNFVKYGTNVIHELDQLVNSREKMKKLQEVAQICKVDQGEWKQTQESIINHSNGVVHEIESLEQSKSNILRYFNDFERNIFRFSRENMKEIMDQTKIKLNSLSEIVNSLQDSAKNDSDFDAEKKELLQILINQMSNIEI